MNEQLVSIGIPTYNRAAKLARAVESVLAQTHRNIELVIVDDASSDDTEWRARAMAAGDGRVRYLRSAVNRGLSENFNLVCRELRGDYVMCLSDDDWLAPDYVERCLGALGGDVLLACGCARYVQESRVLRCGRTMSFMADDPLIRVRGYIRDIDENGILYGLMPREVLNQASPMRNVLGGDWLVVASCLVQGKAVTLADTTLFRDVGGTSASTSKLVATFGLPQWQARLPHLAIAWNVLAEIGWRGDAFTALPRSRRVRLAVLASLSAIRWKSLAWHVVYG